MQHLVLAFVKATFVSLIGFANHLLNLHHLGRFALDHQGRPGNVDRRGGEHDNAAHDNRGDQTGEDFPLMLSHDLPIVAKARRLADRLEATVFVRRVFLFEETHSPA